MAKKEISTQFMIQAPGGSATPAPPLGPALGCQRLSTPASSSPSSMLATAQMRRGDRCAV